MKARKTAPLPAPWRGTSRRPALGSFVLGLLVGVIACPVVLIVGVWLLGGTNAARQATPATAGISDVRVAISRSYLEYAIASNEQFHNPVVQLGAHPQGGAALTLTVGFDLPVVGVQDLQTRSQLLAEDGKLVVNTERVGLGETGRIRIPGGVVERTLSELITREIERRIRSSEGLDIDILAVSATADVLQVDAMVRQRSP